MTQPAGPTFSADSAYAYCKAQCDFGPRLMNTKAHDDCRDWIAQEFRRHGCTVTLQPCRLTAFDGTTLNATNIIARYTPKHLNDSTAERMLLCAHYDTRSWADNDPDEKNHKEPVMGANDGASGVAVMLEVARLISQADSANVGIDFIPKAPADISWDPGEMNIRRGAAELTGRFCVIGAKLNEQALKELFRLG